MLTVSRGRAPHGGPLGSQAAAGVAGGWGLTKDAPSSTQSRTVTFVTESGA